MYVVLYKRALQILSLYVAPSEESNERLVDGFASGQTSAIQATPCDRHIYN